MVPLGLRRRSELSSLVNSSIGVFEALKSLGPEIIDSVVHITILDFYPGPYCSTGYSGSPVTALIDGDRNTLWANNIRGTESVCFYIDFTEYKL